MIRQFQSPKGYFYFQRSRQLVIKTPYMRWSQAWAMHAETSALLALRSVETDEGRRSPRRLTVTE
jgi:hypothetical protein